MRTDFASGELALLQTGEYDEHWRLKIANGDGTMVDVSSMLKGGTVHLPNPDAPIGTAEVRLWRDINDDATMSLAPLVAASAYNRLDDGVTYSALIAVGRAATLEIATTARLAGRPADGSASWHEVLGGFVKQPTLAQYYGDISIELHDRAYKLMRTYVETPQLYTAGTPIEDAVQAVLDDTMGSGAYTLVVDSSGSPTTATGEVLGKDYKSDIIPVWESVQGLVKSIGRVLWYRYDGSGVAQLVLTEPRRTKTVVDYTFTVAQINDISSLTIVEENIRNVVAVSYLDQDGAQQEVTDEDATSIATYGGIRRYVRFAEDETSPIRSSEAATVFRDAALSDLKDPDADQAIATRGAWWPGEAAVDLYGFEANAYIYDSDQAFAPYGTDITFEVGQMSSATIKARGKPSAGAGTWLGRKPGKKSAEKLDLENFREISRTATTIKYGWTIGADLDHSLIHDYKEAQPYSVDKWPAATRLPDKVVNTTDVEYTVTIPEAGQIGYFQVEGRKSDGTFGDMERVLIFPSNVDADFVAYLEATVDQTDGSVLVEGWTTERALSVAYAYTTGTNPTSPTVAMVEAQGTGATGGGLVTGFSSDFSISLGAGTLAYGEKIKVLVVAYLNVDGTGPDGTATDHGLPLGAQGERFKITVSDQITDGIVISNKLREGTRNWITDVAFSATDWDTVAWSSGTLTLSDGTTYAIAAGDTGNLATDALRYIYFDSVVSTTVLQVATATTSVLSEDAILFCVAARSSAGALSGQEAFYIPAVGALGVNSDVLGSSSVLEAKLADAAVATAKLQDLAVSTGKLADLAVTTGKIGLTAVQTAQLDALAVTGAKIAANTVTAANIAALTITAAEIAAATITGAKIAAATITAANITAGTITTTEIAAGTIAAANIAAGTITATEIAALTITAANIVAATITGAKIAAGTIVAGNIAAGTITTAEIAALTIVAGNIAANTITSAEIFAGTITATEIAAATITGAKIAANTIAAGNIVAGTITATEIATGTITAAKMNVSDLSAISANIGTITTGKIAAGSIEINATTERILMGLATAPTTGKGIFIGKDGTDYEFRVGDPAGDYIHFDGSTWTYPGAITNPGMISGLTLTVDDNGTRDRYAVAWSHNSAVAASFDVDIQCYREGVLVKTSTAITATADTATIDDTVSADSASDNHYVVAYLKDASGDLIQSLQSRDTVSAI